MSDITPLRFDVDVGNNWTSIFDYPVAQSNDMLPGDEVVITNYSASTMRVVVSDSQPSSSSEYAYVNLYQGQCFVAAEDTPNIYVTTPTGKCSVGLTFAP